MVVVMMPVTIAMIMGMRMVVVMVVLVMMESLTWAWTSRVLAEDQGLDRHRHRIRRHPDRAEIDVVEIPENDAVDDQDVAFDMLLLTENCAQRLRHVTVEHDVKRLLLGEARRH